jgi:hypothetical protein
LNVAHLYYLHGFNEAILANQYTYKHKWQKVRL